MMAVFFGYMYIFVHNRLLFDWVFTLYLLVRASHFLLRQPCHSFRELTSPVLAFPV